LIRLVPFWRENMKSKIKAFGVLHMVVAIAWTAVVAVAVVLTPWATWIKVGAVVVDFGFNLIATHPNKDTWGKKPHSPS
jgi:hypothetical protein